MSCHRLSTPQRLCVKGQKQNKNNWLRIAAIVKACLHTETVKLNLQAGYVEDAHIHQRKVYTIQNLQQHFFGFFNEQVCAAEDLTMHCHTTLSYSGVALACAGQVGHLSACVGALFCRHYPGPGKPVSQTFCRDLERSAKGKKTVTDLVPLLHEYFILQSHLQLCRRARRTHLKTVKRHWTLCRSSRIKMTSWQCLPETESSTVHHICYDDWMETSKLTSNHILYR